jgi:uncharacterized protein YraI
MTLMSKMMAGAGVLALSNGVAAAAPAVVQNDLNLRAGPGTDYAVIAAMPAGSRVDVMGCEASWCRVAFGGTAGFASRAYLGLGAGVAAASGPSYAYGPGYGYDEDTYAYGGYRPGYTYGYYGDTAFGRSYGSYGGERRFGNERAFTNERTSNNQRRFSEQGAVRSERRVGEEGSARGERGGTGSSARAETQTAPAIKGNNPMKTEKSEPAIANAPAPSAIKGNNPMKVGRGTAANQQRGTARAGNTRGNARETTGAAPRENR